MDCRIIHYAKVMFDILYSAHYEILDFGARAVDTNCDFFTLSFNDSHTNAAIV